MEALGLDLPTFIGQLISFLILLALISVFGYRPIRRVLDERAERIRESMERAEATKKEYEQAQEEVQKRLQQSREQGQELIEKSRAIGLELMEEAADKARIEGQAIISKVKAELEQERSQMVENLRREFVDIAVLAAEKVINETLDRQKHYRLIEETLQESSLLGKVKQ